MSAQDDACNKDDAEGDEVSDLIASFALMPQLLDKYETRFWGVKQSELYKPAGAVIPALPVYHPYHPFRNVTNGDDILQVPLAMAVPSIDWFESVPPPLLERIEKIETPILPIRYFLVAQTLPYTAETQVICRYQYALFPEAKSEMKGHESIWAQSIIYEGGDEMAQIEPTQIKIYESEKNKVSPTILCGDSMKLDTVAKLRGKCIWSLVLGSHADTLGDSGLFDNPSHAFFGLTYFLPGDEVSYDKFVRSTQTKTPRELVAHYSKLPGVAEQPIESQSK